MSFLSLLSIFISIPSALLALGLAVFVLTRDRRALANRWLAIGLAMIGLQQGFMLVSGLVGPGQLGLTLYRLALAAAAAIPPSWFAFSLIFGESNGGLRIAHWRPALLALCAAASIAWIGLSLGYVVTPIRPLEAGPILIGLDAWGKFYLSVYLLGLTLVLFHLENLYRYAERLTRHKIKCLVVGIFVALTWQIFASSYALLYRLIHPLSPLLGSLAFLLGEGMIAFSLVRHRLLNVDIFVSRYVIYRSLTLALVGGYLLSLGVIAEIFHRLDLPLDLLSGTFLAVLGAAALALVLLSDDVRRRSRNFIHEHFYKHKYDYRVEWMQFTRRLANAASPDEIATATANRILEVMWIGQAGLYIVGEVPRQMTLAHQVNYEALPSTLELSDAALEALQEQAKLIPSSADRSDSPDIAARLIQQLFPGILVGSVVALPALDSLIGILVVGPELSGKPFGAADRDLLAAMAAQAGVRLLTARLSQEALEGRDVQVLARLSAFVAHDLKNMVSMLSMLADNARLHIHKPEFQADAIRTLGDATAKMRTLLATFSPNGRPASRPRPISLAPTVEGWLREIKSQLPPRIGLQTRLAWTPQVLGEPDQLRSVLQNLVLNAVEAIPDEGTILVETAQENGHAMLAVTDTGKGMTQEFLRQKLFRPFQTTKPRGLGIGLYQCRQIVQAAGGTLTAESQEGKGTRMVVRLPGLDDSWQQAAGGGQQTPAKCRISNAE